MNCKPYRAKPGKNIDLNKISTHAGIKDADKKQLRKNLVSVIDKISKLQDKLYAEDHQSLLIILQGMDSAGKDGTIKAIMSGVNPQGVLVCSFKHPTELELEHDYLWRHEQKLPEHGQITIFNRSHYENVLISKVHPKLVLAERLPGIDHIKKIDKEFWKMRYKQINYFERRNIQNGTQVLKIFLHLSKKEQGKRFIDRMEHKEKNWKFSSLDIIERKFWKEYQRAYELALKRTSTKIAPWFIVPADDKLYAHCIIGNIILEKLKTMNPVFPPANKKEEAYMKEEKAKLIREYKL
jgi:PPK2 family polyphosphate:nucleotide phosphotransferase